MEDESGRAATLIRSLGDPDRKVVRRAVEALIAIAPELPTLRERLNRLLAESPAERRWPIAYVLARTGAPSPPCLAALREALGSREADIRWAVSLLLARLGKNSRAVVGLLLALRKNGTATQRRMALYCLRDLELKDESSRRAATESLGDPDPLVRLAAVTSLKTLPAGPKETKSLLKLFLSDPDPRVRYNAAIALAALAPPSAELLRAFETAGRSRDPRLKKAARAALDLLKKKGPPAA